MIYTKTKDAPPVPSGTEAIFVGKLPAIPFIARSAYCWSVVPLTPSRWSCGAAFSENADSFLRGLQ